MKEQSQPRYPALVRLDRATALAQAGEVGEACRVAMDAITAPSTYYGIAVHSYARKFSERIRAVQSAETREWREVLAQVEKDKWRDLLHRAQVVDRVVLSGGVGNCQAAGLGDQSPGALGLSSFKDHDGGSERG